MKFFVIMFLAVISLLCVDAETLPPLIGGAAPQTSEELWAGFDPRAEPLDVEVLHEWTEDGVILKIVRYRIGVFKGQKAMMAGVYGYPEGGEDLPALLNIHGGGQYADYKSVLTNAKRGYATISIAWAGRIAAPNYRVSPAEVKLFWDGKKDATNYKITTDWGPLDAYHAPCRNPKNAFGHTSPHPWTLDAVESPRNNPWFLITLGARRALTFLEDQPQVNPDKLGVYGHSMGGKLTVLTTATDGRVKASAPSCGGISDYDTGNLLYDSTIADIANLRNIKCPIIFLSPANDFHGRINDLPGAIGAINSDEWRVTCSAHHNHQDTSEFQIAGQLWMDQYLKGNYRFPETPVSKLTLRTSSGIPEFRVTPDPSKKIISVDIFYTQQGQIDTLKDERINTIHRFWSHTEASSNGADWSADLPVSSINRPLWVYANVLYQLDEPQTGAGYYFGVYTAETVNLSSLVEMVTPEELVAANVKATLKPSLQIEDFEGDWNKEWFTYRPEEWGIKTHKIYDPLWKAPDGARLSFDVSSDLSNTLVVGIDQFVAEVKLKGGTASELFVLSVSDFKNAIDEALPDFTNGKELRFLATEHISGKKDGANVRKKVGATWEGAPPKFSDLKWVLK